MSVLTHLQGFLKIQWGKMGPPLVPSEGECRITKGFIKKGRPRILILGSTPQFRDLAHSLGAQVTCIDMNLDMLTSMVELMKYSRKASQEAWIRANWLQAPLKENYWDYVMGDWVISNIPLKIQPLFFKKISLLLRPGGFFVTRHSLYSGNIITFLGAIDNFLNKKFDISHVVMPAAHLSFNPKTYLSETTECRRMAQNIINDLIKNASDKKLKIKYKEILKLIHYYLPSGMTWTYTPTEVLEKMWRPYFRLTKIAITQDHLLPAACPIYFLKKH